MNSAAYFEYRKMVEDKLLELLPSAGEHASVLNEAMRYSLSAGGKRIRPVLILACCRLSGGDPADALCFAVAAEYIQTYSLIHDDLPAMDNDDYRRGRLSNHKLFGEDVAILAGDGLLSAAYELITGDMAGTSDPELLARKARAAYALSAGTGVRGMVAGQIADIGSEHSVCSPEKLDFIHMNKTAAFIKASVLCGAYIGNATEDLVEKLGAYGEYAGLAFQIVDDIQDVIGDPELRGKRTGGDAENEKSSYPAVYGLDRSQKKADELIAKARALTAGFGSGAELLDDLLDQLSGQVRGK